MPALSKLDIKELEHYRQCASKEEPPAMRHYRMARLRHLMGRIAMRYQLGKAEHRPERRKALLQLARYYHVLRVRQVEAQGRDMDEWRKRPATEHPVGSMQRVCATANAYAASLIAFRAQKKAGATEIDTDSVRTTGRDFLAACDTLKEENAPKLPKSARKPERESDKTPEQSSSADGTGTPQPSDASLDRLLAMSATSPA